jgi:hypothetical protein
MSSNKRKNSDENTSKNSTENASKKLRFDPVVRSSSYNEYSLEELQDFANTIRSAVKCKYGKNVLEFNPLFKPSPVQWKIEDKIENVEETDYEWPTTNREYFQSKEETRSARNESKNECNFIGRWDISNVPDEDNKYRITIYNAVKKVLYIGLITAVVAENLGLIKFYGGKTHARKNKNKKTRRRRRSNKKIQK